MAMQKQEERYKKMCQDGFQNDSANQCYTNPAARFIVHELLVNNNNSIIILKTINSEWLGFLLRNPILLSPKYKVINDFIINCYYQLIFMFSPSPCCSCFKWRKFLQYCVDWWCPRRCCCFNCCFCLLSRKASLNDYYTCALICCTVAF